MSENLHLISSNTNNGLNYYIYNGHGDVVGLINSSGEVTKLYDYNAFGVEKGINEFDSNPFRYCGEYYDKETGTYYLRARYYNPVIGRFTSANSYTGADYYLGRMLGDATSILIGSGMTLSGLKDMRLSVRHLLGL